jgi:hypothetical protein
VGWVQGYNTQVAVNEHQIALAGEITTETIDFGQLRPMVNATVRELDRAGVSVRPSVVLADTRLQSVRSRRAASSRHGA